MKIKELSLFLLIVLPFIVFGQDDQGSKVDYNGFRELSSEIESYRASRLINIETFNEYSKDSETIILDTRSKWAYDQIHVKGAVHLNFSDFTKESLAAVIPNKNTRILIYCNNNFSSDLSSMMDKAVPLALNIPTFINLYGYGYKNVYELQDYLFDTDERVEFERQENTY